LHKTASVERQATTSFASSKVNHKRQAIIALQICTQFMRFLCTIASALAELLASKIKSYNCRSQQKCVCKNVDTRNEIFA